MLGKGGVQRVVGTLPFFLIKVFNWPWARASSSPAQSWSGEAPGAGCSSGADAVGLSACGPVSESWVVILALA